MSNQTVYLLWQIEWNVPFALNHLLSVYGNKDLADKMKEHFEKENPKPVEEDEYGPYGGVSYEVTTSEVVHRVL